MATTTPAADAAAVYKICSERGKVLKRVLSWGNAAKWFKMRNTTKKGRYVVADGYTVAGTHIKDEYVASIALDADGIPTYTVQWRNGTYVGTSATDSWTQISAVRGRLYGKDKTKGGMSGPEMFGLKNDALQAAYFAWLQEEGQDVQPDELHGAAASPAAFHETDTEDEQRPKKRRVRTAAAIAAAVAPVPVSVAVADAIEFPVAVEDVAAPVPVPVAVEDAVEDGPATAPSSPVAFGDGESIAQPCIATADAAFSDAGFYDDEEDVVASTLLLEDGEDDDETADVRFLAGVGPCTSMLGLRIQALRARCPASCLDATLTGYLMVTRKELVRDDWGVSTAVLEAMLRNGVMDFSRDDAKAHFYALKVAALFAGCPNSKTTAVAKAFAALPK